jgi:galactonate dehydratase
MHNTMLARRARLMAFSAPQALTAAKTSPQLEISALQAYPVREPVSGRSYTIIKLQTRGGLVGYGECAKVTAPELAQVLQAVRGKEVTQFETLRQQLKNQPAGLMAALNMAMLDAAGRWVKAPVYQVLGGPTRNKCRALAPLEGTTDTELAASVRRAREAGFKAFLVPTPPVVWRNQGQAFVLAARKRLDTLRQAAGPGTDFVLDGGGSLAPGDAASLAEAFERYHLLWLDEPCGALNLGAVKKIAAENVTPVGLGRFIQQPGAFQDLLREDAIDILRPDISLNGISQIRQMAAIAETYYVAVAPYHNGGPVASAAALQLAASLPNFFIQQIPLPQADPDRKMRAALAGGAEVVRDGFAELPVGPGLGITVNEKALEQYKERAE